MYTYRYARYVTKIDVGIVCGLATVRLSFYPALSCGVAYIQVVGTNRFMEHMYRYQTFPCNANAQNKQNYYYMCGSLR